MKSVVKIVKSLHADSHTLSAMFFGYFVLLAVTATMIMNGNKPSNEAVATSKVKTEQTSRN